MSWRSTLTRLLALCALVAAGPAAAQSLESVVMPGAVIAGHAKWETDCQQCHVRFERNAQTQRCLDCHKPVAADVRDKTGYHGRLKDPQCRSCHTEHKGRGARLVHLDETKFDHAQTDFALHGKHRGKRCDACHKPSGEPPKLKHNQAPLTCTGCHRKDDKHKNGLGQKCENCHNENSWKEARFDHAKTHFPLLKKHADVKCADCHSGEKYVDTPRACVSCHRKDDTHKNVFGQKCDSCHREDDWKRPIFRHDHDTKFVLLDKHRPVKCDSCHRAPVAREKTPTRCVACHRQDDQEKGHQGKLGDKCDKCHNEKGWKGGALFDHQRDTKFALLDKHKDAKCNACHKDKGMREKLAMDCYSCHRDDDQKKGHQGALGEKCDKCHHIKGFKPSLFEHGRDTTFSLIGKHDKAKCTACHKEQLFRRKADSKIDKQCFACHKDDDVHFATLGHDCERCHVADDWRKVDKSAAQRAGIVQKAAEKKP